MGCLPPLSLAPLDSGSLGLWPQGGARVAVVGMAIHRPAPKPSHLHVAQQGPLAAACGQAEALVGSLQGQANQRLDGLPSVPEQGLHFRRLPVGTGPQQHTFLLTPWGQEGTCC